MNEMCEGRTLTLSIGDGGPAVLGLCTVDVDRARGPESLDSRRLLHSVPPGYGSTRADVKIESARTGLPAGDVWCRWDRSICMGSVLTALVQRAPGVHGVMPALCFFLHRDCDLVSTSICRRPVHPTTCACAQVRSDTCAYTACAQDILDMCEHKGMRSWTFTLATDQTTGRCRKLFCSTVRYTRL